jgi:hypothetical protein
LFLLTGSFYKKHSISSITLWSNCTFYIIIISLFFSHFQDNEFIPHHLQMWPIMFVQYQYEFMKLNGFYRFQFIVILNNIDAHIIPSLVSRFLLSWTQSTCAMTPVFFDNFLAPGIRSCFWLIMHFYCPRSRFCISPRSFGSFNRWYFKVAILAQRVLLLKEQALFLVLFTENL